LYDHDWQDVSNAHFYPYQSKEEDGSIRSVTENLNEKFKEEYAMGLSEKWDEIINWEKRKENENGFFEEILDSYGVTDVLDMACGTGFHAIHLANQGFNVDATDGSEAMLSKTLENAHRYNADITVGQADWLNLTDVVSKQYDAVVCLGNALTHLFYDELYQKAIREVYKVLKKGGIFIVDQRNYDSILDHGYSSKHKYYYCGEEVAVHPVVVQEDLVKFEYKFSENDKYYLTMHPIRKDVLGQHLLNAGFDSVKTYGDFKQQYDPYEPDFIVHVAEKWAQS